jgi:hypothetical protein
LTDLVGFGFAVLTRLEVNDFNDAIFMEDPVITLYSQRESKMLRKCAKFTEVEILIAIPSSNFSRSFSFLDMRGRSYEERQCKKPGQGDSGSPARNGQEVACRANR